MTLGLYIGAALLYFIIAGVPYTKYINTKAYWLVALLGIATQASWLGIAKLATDKQDIMMKGIYFDVTVTLIYIVLPIVAFDVTLTRNNVIGIGLIFLGLLVSKL